MSKKLLFIGDSITDASRVYNAVGAQRPGAIGYGFTLQIAGRILAEDPTKYEIINTGASGHKIYDLYARMKRDIWNFEPDVVTLLDGFDDLYSDLLNDTGVDIDRYYTFYDMLLTETKKHLPNAKIILLEPFFLKGSLTEDKLDGLSKLKDYAKVVKDLAEKHGLYFIPLQDLFNDLAEKNGAENYLSDGVHPTVVGASIIAEEWIKFATEKGVI